MVGSVTISRLVVVGQKRALGYSRQVRFLDARSSLDLLLIRK